MALWHGACGARIDHPCPGAVGYTRQLGTGRSRPWLLQVWTGLRLGLDDFLSLDGSVDTLAPVTPSPVNFEPSPTIFHTLGAAGMNGGLACNVCLAV